MSYVRKTYDEWHVQGYYGREYGWETVCIATSLAEAKRDLKDYRENEPQYPHRVIKRRIKK